MMWVLDSGAPWTKDLAEMHALCGSWGAARVRIRRAIRRIMFGAAPSTACAGGHRDICLKAAELHMASAKCLERDRKRRRRPPVNGKHARILAATWKGSLRGMLWQAPGSESAPVDLRHRVGRGGLELDPKSRRAHVRRHKECRWIRAAKTPPRGACLP